MIKVFKNLIPYYIPFYGMYRILKYPLDPLYFSYGLSVYIFISTAIIHSIYLVGFITIFLLKLVGKF